MWTRNVGVDESKALICSDIFTWAEPPPTARPEPPDTLVTLDSKVWFYDVHLLGGFIPELRAKVVETIIFLAEALELKELEAGRGIVFAPGAVRTRDRLPART